MPVFYLETQADEPITTRSGARITIFRRKLSLNLPGLHRQAAWARPLAVLVQTPDGIETLVPAADTLQQLWTFAALTALLGLAALAWLTLRRRAHLHRRG